MRNALRIDIFCILRSWSERSTEKLPPRMARAPSDDAGQARRSGRHHRRGDQPARIRRSRICPTNGCVKLAPVLGTRPGHLLEVDPADVSTDILDIWADIPEERRQQARRRAGHLPRPGRGRRAGADRWSRPSPSVGSKLKSVTQQPQRSGAAQEPKGIELRAVGDHRHRQRSPSAKPPIAVRALGSAGRRSPSPRPTVRGAIAANGQPHANAPPRDRSQTFTTQKESRQDGAHIAAVAISAPGKPAAFQPIKSGDHEVGARAPPERNGEQGGKLEIPSSNDGDRRPDGAFPGMTELAPPNASRDIRANCTPNRAARVSATFIARAATPGRD